MPGIQKSQNQFKKILGENLLKNQLYQMNQYIKEIRFLSLNMDIWHFLMN